MFSLFGLALLTLALPLGIVVFLLAPRSCLIVALYAQGFVKQLLLLGVVEFVEAFVCNGFVFVEVWVAGRLNIVLLGVLILNENHIAITQLGILDITQLEVLSRPGTFF